MSMMEQKEKKRRRKMREPRAVTEAAIHRTESFGMQLRLGVHLLIIHRVSMEKAVKEFKFALYS
jgi:hypothetical protein